MKILIKAAIYISLMIASVLSSAQEAKSSELYQTLKRNDSLIFEQSFNRCNHSDMENLLAEDLEFYHDTSGITSGKETFLNTIKKNICGNPTIKPIRTLEKESLKVFPLYNKGELYGAIQNGDHNFYLRENGKTRPTVKAKFTHLWTLENNKWVLKRVLSYDHQPLKN